MSRPRRRARSRAPAAWHVHALENAAPAVFWFDDPRRPAPLDPLGGCLEADLVVVGGGYAGLWSALVAKERHPDRDVVLLEARRCGDAASGRNGGFCAASLTHGFGNALARWPEELADLERLGAQNLDEVERAIARYDIDCGFERTGELAVATSAHQVAELAEEAADRERHGVPGQLLDADHVRSLVDSPTYLGALLDRTGCALVEPARLAWGLRAACLRLGVRIFEHSRVEALRRSPTGVEARCRGGVVRARNAVLATNAFRPLLRRLRLMTAPVYDYVLVTEPLTPDQRAAIGWRGREGIGDAANQFHYYRLTRDDRVLWGGYDAIYHYGSRIDPRLEHRAATFETLSRNFFRTFPQLHGVRFTHRWAGVIDTCTRFTAFYGTALEGRVSYALGFTGLGVGASRFAAEVMLDLLDARDTARTRLRMVRERPLPFPPEPLRYAGIQLTRWSLARADRNGGRRNMWLRALDRGGLGFDS